MSKMLLYNYFRSSTSYRVRIALNLKGIDYDYHPVSLLKDGGEQHKPEYRAINPLGGVPTLVHDGKTISQSLAIIEYLDEVFPSPPLFPKDPYSKAKVRQICENINADTHPLQNLKVQSYLEHKLGATPGQKEEWLIHWITSGLSATEQILSQTAGRYCFGNDITAADLVIVPQAFSAERFKVDISRFPVMKKIVEECLQNDAFKRAHPFRQPDTPPENRVT